MLLSLFYEHDICEASVGIAMACYGSGWVWTHHVRIVRPHHVEVNYEAPIKTYALTMATHMGEELRVWGVLCSNANQTPSDAALRRCA